MGSPNKKSIVALAGVAQLALCHPRVKCCRFGSIRAHTWVVGSVSGWGTCKR